MQKSVAETSLLTRRSWAALLAAAPLAAQVASTPQRTPPPLAAPSASDNVRTVSEKLAQIAVPMSLEPAFTFHV